ncbi:polysaccharide biosynthesis protein [Psychrobacter pygoscelis]|uniref:polysaccharide biosynthesis protein n=1 Tax=Psychrobacter pygoscelis TaxID=2488563 RepID=UPI00103C0841|nr:nucleoside-diphosphate sugar epimerase/dehydratase [Psychrobacter pygoscelis]
MTISVESNNNTQRPLSDNCYVSDEQVPMTVSYRLAKWLLGLPRQIKQVILLIVDYVISIFCLFCALSLRYGTIDNHVSPVVLALYAVVPVIGLYAIGFYKGVARIFYDGEMHHVLQLFVLLVFVFAITHYLHWTSYLPRSVPLLYLFLLFICLWNSRLTLRELLARWEGKHEARGNSDIIYENVIIYGAGKAGKALFEELRHSSRYQVIAFVDEDSRLTGAHILGKKIYAAANLINLVTKFDISQVFLAMPTISQAHRRKIIDSLSSVSVKIKQLPSMEDIADGKVTVSTLREVDILDVLDRQTVAPVDELLHQDIKGKGVLVTGAGGSIGSELCRQIIKNQPRCLVLFELSEYALYAVHQELKSQQAALPEADQIEIIALIGNVINEGRLRTVFKQYQIQTVYHAAAYKHVPIVEHNPFEGVINNSKGTYHCVRAAVDAEVETFVLISTDKAVRPTNIMGASKRLAELVCQGMSQSDISTRISMVRFGNVLGSSGSVVPLFTKQIECGGPITVTHPEVTRYFMTIPEAANLVIQAGAMAHGGEVFVLDMGSPVKIVDLARRMVLLSGCEPKDNAHPNGDIEIIFTGLRPGEKLYEELIIGESNIESTRHPLIMQAVEDCFPLADIEAILAELTEKAQQEDVIWLKRQFRYFVSGYQECVTPA